MAAPLAALESAPTGLQATPNFANMDATWTSAELTMRYPRLDCEQNLRWALFSQSVDVIYPSGSIITLVIAVFERNLPGIEPGPLGWYTSAITTRLQEVRQ